MAKTKTQKKALSTLNLDLFKQESLTPPAPATIHTKIKEHLKRRPLIELPVEKTHDKVLPAIEELYILFERYNWSYFDGQLPRVNIEYSHRMSCAGSYTPRKKLIRIGYKYHLLFPEEISDTLKHEMIHLKNFKHNAAFKKEAERIGASIKAKRHPLLQKSPKYLYICPSCKKEYPRQR
ncbi:MAG: SprT-like domain-containing protein, partial [Candidatus Zixiibacteriota bacterium]